VVAAAPRGLAEIAGDAAGGDGESGDGGGSALDGDETAAEGQPGPSRSSGGAGMHGAGWWWASEIYADVVAGEKQTHTARSTPHHHGFQADLQSMTTLAPFLCCCALNDTLLLCFELLRLLGTTTASLL
jgi:hypothetical protein